MMAEAHAWTSGTPSKGIYLPRMFSGMVRRIEQSMRPDGSFIVAVGGLG